MTPKQPKQHSIDASTDKKSSYPMEECKLASCNEKFEKRRYNKDFCCDNHRKQFWNLSTTQIAELANEAERLKKRNAELEERVEGLEKRMDKIEGRIK